MTNKLLPGLLLVVALSCSKDDGDNSVKQGNGNVWFSGGLAQCAEQIHLDNGNKLIVKVEDILSFKSGDRISVKYKEIGINQSCSPAIDCIIIEIKKVE
jgi:hypothetical protein